jgi:Dolichyl-phosphate-mannose-protein mannosyltransferase
VRLNPFVAASIVVGALGLAFLAGTDLRGVPAGFLDGGERVTFWGLLFAACARLAARVLRSRLTGLPHLVWDGAAGLALLIALLLVIGLLPGGFRPTTVRLVLTTVVLAGGILASSDPVARFKGSERPDASTGGLVALLVVLAVVGLAWDRVPPVFFDTRAYHFAFPEMWLIGGRIAPESWSLHSWFPPGMSVLYGIGLTTGGEAWANDANLLVGLCLVAGAFDLGRRLFGAPAGILAAGLVVALPLTLYALAIPGADLGHGLFAFLALGCLLVRSTDDARWLERAALLTAGAVLTKYLGLMVPLALGAAWLVAARSRPAFLLRFAAPSIVLALPWLAANAVTVGNPVAPVAGSVVPTRGLADGGAASFRGDARGGLPGWGDVQRLGPRWLTGSAEDSRLYPTPAFGWLPLALLPFTLLAVPSDRTMRCMLGLTVLLLVVWFLTFRWERFLVAAATLACVTLAGGVFAASRRWRSFRVLPLVVALGAAASLPPTIAAIGRFNHGGRVALGLEGARDFIEGGLDSVRLFHRANDTLDPRRDRVLLLGEMRHYGLAVPRCAPTGFNSHPLVEALRQDPDPRAADRALRRRGFTHLIVDPGWVARSAAEYPSLSYFADHPDVLQRYLRSLGPPLAVEGHVALFAIPAP